MEDKRWEAHVSFQIHNISVNEKQAQKGNMHKALIFLLPFDLHQLSLSPHPPPQYLFRPSPISSSSPLVSILFSAPVLMGSGGSLFREKAMLDLQSSDRILAAADFSSFFYIIHSEMWLKTTHIHTLEMLCLQRSAHTHLYTQTLRNRVRETQNRKRERDLAAWDRCSHDDTFQTRNF